MYSLVESREAVNNWLERYGVRFGIYKNGKFKEQLFPFDPIPRVIEPEEWAYLEKGLAQRVRALNLFLADVYGEKNIIKNNIVPKSFIYASKGYLPQCEGIRPPHGVFAHIAGIDLVQARDGSWFVLEDNLRIPSGASYPLIARSISRKVSPETFAANHIEDNRDYPQLLKHTMDDMNVNGGLNVVFTPGRYNSAFFEHSYLAERTGAVLAFPGDLLVEDNHVYYQGIFHEKALVGAIYRRVSDEYLDPMAFEPDSLLGVPNLMQAYAAGNVADNVVSGYHHMITPDEFVDLWDHRDENNYLFVDIRPAKAGKPIEERHPGQYLSLPLEEFNARAKKEIPTDRPVALVCNTGTRAYEAQLKLREMGIETVNSAGGHTALRKRGDEDKF